MAAAAILDFKTQIDTRDAPDRSKFVILKIQDGGGRYVKKIEKSTYQLRFERFWRNFAQWRSAVRPSRPFWPLKIQDRGGRHLEISKNRDISAMVWPIATKCGMMTQFDTVDASNH